MADAALLPEFTGFFAAAKAGHLAFPRCEDCGRFHWYPMPRCPHCRSARIAWRNVRGEGELFSYTEVRHAFDPSRRGEVPYVVGLVTFADAPGVRMITNIVGSKATELRIGQRVVPVFPGDQTEPVRVVFRPAAVGEGGQA